MRPACAALGIAFQLSDDILDVTSESLQSGKTPGTDLREGVRSMPVLHALATAGPGDARLVELLSSDLSDPVLLDEALGLLRKHPGLDLARADVRHWAKLGPRAHRGPARCPGPSGFRRALRLHGRPHELSAGRFQTYPRSDAGSFQASWL